VVVALGLRITNWAPERSSFDPGVAFLLVLVEGEAVLEAGTAAAGDIDPQLEVVVALFLDELADLLRGAVGENQGAFGFGRHVANSPQNAFVWPTG